VAKTSALIYQVAVGEVPPFYHACIASVARYCQRYGFEHVVQTEPILRVRPVRSARSENALRLGYLPIYEKENAFSYLDRFERVAVLDADVFVRPDAPDLFAQLRPEDEFAAVLERDMPLTAAYRTKIVKHSEAQFRPLTDVDWHWERDGAAFYNMGVMVFSAAAERYLDGQTPGEFVRRPEFERFVNGEGHWRWSTDQTLLNWWVKKSGMRVRNLDWRWNALYGAVVDVRSAYFVHFFLSAKRTEAELAALVRSL
jgi:hypothetical protein